MTAPSVIVPLFGADDWRLRNWHFLRALLPPEWEVIESDGATKGDAVNRGVERASSWALVILDADVWIPLDYLRASVAALAYAPWVVPHQTVWRLTEQQSTTVIRTGRWPTLPVRCRAHRGPAGGGAVVVTRAGFDAVHGIDPRFVGWGGDDISFARALDTVVGRHLRVGASMLHLWHEPMPRRSHTRGSIENEHLAARYLDAAGDVDAMRELCEEHRV